jgi:hypothetical protein
MMTKKMKLLILYKFNHDHNVIINLTVAVLL